MEPLSTLVDVSEVITETLAAAESDAWNDAVATLLPAAVAEGERDCATEALPGAVRVSSGEAEVDARVLMDAETEHEDSAAARPADGHDERQLQAVGAPAPPGQKEPIGQMN